MGYNAAAQVLKKAEDLKIKVSQKCDLLNDSDIWSYQQQLQTLYHQVLVLDLEYALDKKVEQELWTLGFKNHITGLQELSRDKKNPNRSDCQALLSWCLESASGFYLTLLQELCTTFDLDLPFRRRGTAYGQAKENLNNLNLPQSSSYLYICQYCLVHLGDIARYRNQRKQAASFYKQAILVSPNSGHPYNQLALLEASQGNRLSTVFHYIRGIMVKNPFPASVTNLMNTLSAAVEKECPLTNINTKMTAAEFIQLFLCVHGLLHTASDLDQAELGVKSMNATLTALVATQSFTTEKLLEITIINLYTLKHIMENGTSKLQDLTEDETIVRELVLDLLAGSISAFLIPVHTLKLDESLLDYYALPAVKFLSYWIESDPDLLKEKVFSSRLQIWPSLCKLLNSVQLYLKDFDYTLFEKSPLPEDREMQGFMPLAKHFSHLDFKSDEIEDVKVEKLIRAKRLVNFGMWLTEYGEKSDVKLVVQNKTTDGSVTFEPACIQPDPTENLLEEMKSFSFAESQINKTKSHEKRGGILKPQGSLERSREEREQVLLSNNERGDASNIEQSAIGKPDTAKSRRVKQNVALQSIFKKMEENKQVKFNVEVSNKEEQKLPKFETKPPTLPLPNSTPHIHQTFRTQTFSQNHPALTAVQSDLSKDVTPNNPVQSKTQYDKSNILHQKTDLSQINLPFPMPNQSQMFPSNQNINQQRNYQQSVPNSMNMHPPQFRSVQYPPYNNTWKQEERPAVPPNNPWWSNVGQSFPQQDNSYQMNMQYSNSVPSYLPPRSGFPSVDYGNKPSMEVYSPWSNQGSSASNQPIFGYDNASQNMSMRQLMLKEATNMPGMGFNPAASRMNNVPKEKNVNVMPHTASYSLFNTNSWNPNLPGQLKNSQNPHDNLSNTLRHNTSLFTGQGPQSLAQLLEQQNQWQKNDP